MGARDDRVEAIHAASRENPLVQFTLESLEDDAETFAAPESLDAELVSKLEALEGPDAMLSAMVGLADLAYLMQEKYGAFEVGEVILQALGKVQPQIDKALATLPESERAAFARRDGFAGGKAAEKAVSLDGAPKGHVSNAGFDLTGPARPKK